MTSRLTDIEKLDLLFKAKLSGQFGIYTLIGPNLVRLELINDTGSKVYFSCLINSIPDENGMWTVLYKAEPHKSKSRAEAFEAAIQTHLTRRSMISAI